MDMKSNNSTYKCTSNKTLSSNTYTMSNAVITNTQTGSSISISGSTITVTVENKLIPKDSEYNLKLVKVEQGNTSKSYKGQNLESIHQLVK